MKEVATCSDAYTEYTLFHQTLNLSDLTANTAQYKKT